MRKVRTLQEERGFTLPEMLATLVILGVLVTIAVIVLLGILEQRRVDAAALQLASDMRLAHTKATNQLTDWRVVVVLYVNEDDSQPDYYLVRLKRPYGSGAAPEIDRVEPRFLPDYVNMKNVVSPKGSLVDKQSSDYWVAPWQEDDAPVGVQTKTLEFNSDGTMSFFISPNGSICVTQDGSPQNRTSALASTSRVLTEFESSCNTKTKDD